MWHYVWHLQLYLDKLFLQLTIQNKISDQDTHGPGLGDAICFKSEERASLEVQWLRIRLLVQGTRVRALGWEYPTCREQLSPCATTTEPAL